MLYPDFVRLGFALTEEQRDIRDMTTRLFGGHGYSHDYGLEGPYRDARAVLPLVMTAEHG